MKKTLKDVVFLLLLGFTIYLCFRNYKLNSYISQLPDSSVIGIPDTIKLKEEFKPKKPFSQLIEPSRILLYDFYRNSNRMTKSPSSDSTAVDSDNSVKVSNQDSLVQIVLKKDKLNLSLFNKETNTYSTRLFPIDLDKYNYNWYEGQLTRKKVARLSLSPYVYGKYRPFNNLFDMGAGLSIKTKRFNYKFGVSTFYYPKIKSGIGTDIEFQITYNF